MKISTLESTDQSNEHDVIFAQGAGAIASDGRFCTGLWFNHTPEHQGRSVGTIGACQIDDSPEASGFLSNCADYLHRSHQCSTVVGPMNGNTWLQHRLIIESRGRDPFLMEPIEPDYFFNTFSAAGFSILSEYSSSTIDLTAEQKDYTSMASRLEKKGVHFLTLFDHIVRMRDAKGCRDTG